MGGRLTVGGVVHILLKLGRLSPGQFKSVHERQTLHFQPNDSSLDQSSDRKLSFSLLSTVKSKLGEDTSFLLEPWRSMSKIDMSFEDVCDDAQDGFGAFVL
jgi:hypothetical protein